MIGKQEFISLRRNTPDALILRYEKEILRLVNKIVKKEGSGNVVPIVGILVGDTIKKLCNNDPLGPLYDEDGWIDHGNFYQHKRCPAVFKDKKDNLPYYIEALIWRTPRNTQFTGHVRIGEVGDLSAPMISSRMYIKFPFIPKRFVIDIEDIEYEKNENTLAPKENGGWWESWTKLELLKEAFEYYDYKLDGDLQGDI